jgi:exonuclease III
MSLLCWNCRGLRNPQTVQDLHQMVQEKKPKFVFLIETLSKQKQMEKIKSRLGFEGLFVVEPIGRSEGLALL